MFGITVSHHDSGEATVIPNEHIQEMDLVTEKCAYSLVTAMTLSAKRCIFSLSLSIKFWVILSFFLSNYENVKIQNILRPRKIRIFVFFCEIRDRRSESKPTKKTINTILCLRRSNKNLFLFLRGTLLSRWWIYECCLRFHVDACDWVDVIRVLFFLR